MEIKHPEWLQIELDGCTLFGYNQDWYKTSFQKTRGCGPTAASMLLSYLNQREDEPLPYKQRSISQVIQALDNVWSFVTPGWLLGLNSTTKFCRGVEELLRHYGLPWRCNRLSITACSSKRAPLSQVVKFLENGLASDCPIAFLNLHRGQARVLESWHWIVLVELSYDESQDCYLATCYDGGRTITFDLGLWLKTSNLGGGFVYITVQSEKPLVDEGF